MTTMAELHKRPMPKWMIKTKWGAFEYYGIIDYQMLEKGVLVLFTPDNRLTCCLSPGSWEQFSAVYTDDEGSEYYPVDKPNWGPTDSSSGQNPEADYSDQQSAPAPSDPDSKVVQLRPGARIAPPAAQEPPPYGGPAA